MTADGDPETQIEDETMTPPTAEDSRALLEYESRNPGARTWPVPQLKDHLRAALDREAAEKARADDAEYKADYWKRMHDEIRDESIRMNLTTDADYAKRVARLAAERDAARAEVEKMRGVAEGPFTLEQWGEDDGCVLWWAWRDGDWLGEEPYVGSPLDCGITVEMRSADQPETVIRHHVGGWPGYHTHWTPLPAQPAALAQETDQ